MTTKISRPFWLPLITPFKDGAIDFASYDRLVNHYIAKGVDGLLPLGTTGGSPALDEDEIAAVIERTLAVADGRVPVFAGVGGNATAKVEKELKRLRHLPIAGILSVCPYYNRPSQDGLIAHFRRIAAATDRDVVIYNIPYRTAVNLSNDSLLELAEVPNIVGVKDSSGSVEQSLELLRRKPSDFAVLTGEDALFFTMRANGAEGRHPGRKPSRDRRLRRGRALLPRPTISPARARPGRRSPASCRCCSPKPTRCRSSISCGGRG